MPKKKRHPRKSRRTEASRNKLVLANLGLVHRIVQKMRRGNFYKSRLSYEEAISAGTMGLIRAAELWCASRRAKGQPIKFGTYAWRAIRSRIKKEAQEASVVHIPRHVQDELTILRRTDSPAETAPQIAGVKAAYPRSLANYDSAEIEYDAETGNGVRSAMAQLPIRACHVLRRHFFLRETYEAIGDRAGVTKEAIRQRICRALELLRKVLRP